MQSKWLGSGVVIGALLIGAGATRAEETEKKIKESEVPKPVLAAVSKKYPGAKLKGFEQESEDGKTLYEVSSCPARAAWTSTFRPKGKSWPRRRRSRIRTCRRR